MKTLKTWGWMILLGMAACATEDMEPGLGVATSIGPVEVVVAMPDAFDAQAKEDLDGLVTRLSDMSEALGWKAGDALVRVTFLGQGEVVEDEDYKAEYQTYDDDLEVDVDPTFVRWDTVSLRSKNEFQVAFPRTLLSKAGEKGAAEGLHLGSDVAREEDEKAPTQVDFFDGPDGLEGFDNLIFGWSNGVDTRILRGTYNTAQTHTAYEKLVDIGGCSGTMVGPKHIVTAAHCIRDFDDSRWVSSTARAGRSGNAWRDSVSFSTSDTWYWTPSTFRSIADGQEDMPFSATPYDIGVIVTHGDRMGNTVGWMGWYWWSSDSSFGNRVRYNRGYPICGRNNSPAGCQTNGLYGDTAYCATGDYSSPDSDGINRRFRLHCDISGGHSGSSLYHYLNGSTLVVTSVVSWEHCRTCSAGDNRPNTGVRITKSYSDSISWLRQTFP